MVKTPVDGVEFPMGVALMDPPLMEALPALKFVNMELPAEMFVAETEVKTPVDGVEFPMGVPLMDPPVKTAFEDVTFVINAFVTWIVGAMSRPRSSRLVPVAFTNMALPILVRPET